MIVALNLIVIAFAALFWHELAHFVVADRYKAVNRVSLVRHDGKYLRWVIFGPAVNVDREKLTDRELWKTMLAPLVWIVPGLALLVGTYYLPITELATQGLVWLLAGLVVLFSDIPQYFTLGLDDDGYQEYTLIDFEGKYE